MSAVELKKSEKDWKEKYYQLLDQLDAQESLLESSEDSLISFIVKLCISHQGHNKTLDNGISTFRKKIRNTKDRKLREQLIQTVLDQILANNEEPVLDNKNSANDNPLIVFLDQLETNSEHQHGISRLKQKLSEQPTAEQNNKLIQQLSSYMNELLQERSDNVVPLSNKQDNLIPVLSKLHLPANSNNQLKQLSSRLQSVSEHQEQLKTIEEIIFLLNELLNEPNETSSDLNNTYELFIQLLEWISIPENFKQEFSQLKDEFTEESFQLNPQKALKNISDFISQINRSLQAELGEIQNYLSKVILRLKEFEEHLVGSQSQQANSLSKAEQFNTQMKESAEQLKNDIDSCNDIDEIKITLDSHLEIIDANLDIHLKSEQEKQHESQKAIESLAKRVVQIENESQRLQKTIIEERNKALKDALTGIANRHAYEDKIQEEFSRCERYGQSLSLGIIDIDDFKKINDQYGHTAGDRVLKTVAKLCDDKIRNIDFIARYGGEEFVLVFPNTNLEQSLVAAENLRNTVSKCVFQYNKKKVPITVSIGIAEFAKEDDIETVFNRADNALYEAKNSGKNRCVTQ